MSYHWKLWKENIGLSQIVTEWTVLSFCAKWLGSSRRDVEYHDTFDMEDKRDDMELLARLWELLDEADLVIAQNGKRFDLRKIRARMVMLGFPPFSPIRVIDTMLMAKETFGFTSNKLEWMANALSPVKKRKHKKFPGFDLWVGFLDGVLEARKEMRLYNIDDVISMEFVYLAIRPWCEGHPNVAAFYPDTEMRCAACGSTELTKQGFQYTQTGQYQRYVCACGKWQRSRYTMNTLTKRKALTSQ